MPSMSDFPPAGNFPSGNSYNYKQKTHISADHISKREICIYNKLINRNSGKEKKHLYWREAKGYCVARSLRRRSL